MRKLEFMQTIAYGAAEQQVGDLYLPDAERAAVVCLLHGGFWRVPYARDHIAPLARWLRDHGFVVWNLDYRRVGDPGGGWPGTLQDVACGVEHLAALAAGSNLLDLSRVIAIGHSAGGQLALWAAARSWVVGGARIPKRVHITHAVGLAAVSDLRSAYDCNCGNGAVRNFLGGSPADRAERYRTSSPAEMLPLGAKQFLIHGPNDTDVPVEVSRRYASYARAARDDIESIELTDAGHMDLIEPGGEPSRLMLKWLMAR